MYDKDDIKQEKRILALEKENNYRMIDILRSKQYCYSWNDKFEHQNIDFLEDSEMPLANTEYEQIDNITTVKEALRCLSGRDRRIMYWIFVKGFSRKLISQMYGLHISTISKIIKRSILKIRLAWSIQI